MPSTIGHCPLQPSSTVCYGSLRRVLQLRAIEVVLAFAQAEPHEPGHLAQRPLGRDAFLEQIGQTV